MFLAHVFRRVKPNKDGRATLVLDNFIHKPAG